GARGAAAPAEGGRRGGAPRAGGGRASKDFGHTPPLVRRPPMFLSTTLHRFRAVAALASLAVGVAVGQSEATDLFHRMSGVPAANPRAGIQADVIDPGFDLVKIVAGKGPPGKPSRGGSCLGHPHNAPPPAPP